MRTAESDTQSFIVKIWLEETTREASGATWRGHITHVPSGNRWYIDELDEIAASIAPFLKEMGIRLPVCWQVRHWFRQSTSHLKQAQ